MRTLEPGSYSFGTLRAEDLIRVVFEIAGDLDTTAEPCADCAQYRDESAEIIVRDENLDGEGGEANWENASEIIGEAFDHFDAHCPEGFYFGTIEGDGAEYGVWLSPDYINDLAADLGSAEDRVDALRISRLTTIRTMQAMGAGVAEIGEAFGISRQRVEQILSGT